MRLSKSEMVHKARKHFYNNPLLRNVLGLQLKRSRIRRGQKHPMGSLMCSLVLDVDGAQFGQLHLASVCVYPNGHLVVVRNEIVTTFRWLNGYGFTRDAFTVACVKAFRDARKRSLPQMSMFCGRSSVVSDFRRTENPELHEPDAYVTMKTKEGARKFGFKVFPCSWLEEMFREEHDVHDMVLVTIPPSSLAEKTIASRIRSAVSKARKNKVRQSA